MLLEQRPEGQSADSADQAEALIDSTGNAVEIYGLQKLFRRHLKW